MAYLAPAGHLAGQKAPHDDLHQGVWRCVNSATEPVGSFATPLRAAPLRGLDTSSPK